jgi:hypothetical protein
VVTPWFLSPADRMGQQRPGLDYPVISKDWLVLPDRIELSTSPLPMECSTTELRQHVLG